MDNNRNRKQNQLPSRNLGLLVEKINFLCVITLLVTTPFAIAHVIFQRPTVSQEFYFEFSVCIIFILMVFIHIISGIVPRAIYHRLFIPSIVFGCVLLLPAFLSSEPIFRLFSIRECLLPISGILFFLLCANLTWSQMQIKKIISVLVIIGTIMALYGILQYFGVDIRIGQIGYRDEEKMGKLAVLSLAGHPNFLSAYLSPIALMSIAFMFTSKTKRIFFLLLSVVCILLFCVFISGARGSWVGLFAAGIFLIFSLPMERELRKHFKRLFGSLAAGFLLLVLIFSIPNPLVPTRYNMLNRLLNKTALLTRIYGFRVALDMIRDNPIVGSGFRSYEVHFWEYAAKIQKGPEGSAFEEVLEIAEGKPPGHVHNEYLEIAVSAGVIGIMAFFLILITFFSQNHMAIAQSSSLSSKVMLSFLASGVLYYLVLSLVSFPLQLPLSGPIFWFLLAVGVTPKH